LKEEVKDKYEKIIFEAEKEFASNGYYGASVDNIAFNSNVGKGTVYRYFGDKDSLFLEVVRKLLGMFSEKIKRRSKAFTFKEYLSNLVENYTEIFYEEKDYVKVIYHSISKSFTDKNWNRNFNDFKDAEFDLIKEMIEIGIGTGEIHHTEDFEKLSKFIWIILKSIPPRIVYLNENAEEIKQQNKYMQSMLLQSLKKEI
jgi:AcrR family transcriptional regulator